MAPKHSRLVSTTILAGLTAAVLEFLPALIVQGARGASPLQLLQSIASGVQGQDAYDGGVASGLLGATLLLMISLVAAGVFVLASRRWPILIDRYISAGLLYGLLCYTVTNFVMVPHAAVALAPATAWSLVSNSIAVQLVSVGLPIAVMTRLATLRARWS